MVVLLVEWFCCGGGEVLLGECVGIVCLNAWKLEKGLYCGCLIVPGVVI